MTSKTTPAAPVGETAGQSVRKRNNSTIRPNTKLHRVITALAEGGRYHRFTAERVLNDHTLHSTVSAIQNKGISVHREWIKVPCLSGSSEVDVCLYSLTETEQLKALRLLGRAE